MYCDKTLKKYLDDLAARLPAPGGGSAAGLTASLGASLISMVVNFTIGKPKYAKYENELREILKDSEVLRKKCLDIVDLDVLAYKSKDVRSSMDVPFSLCRICFEGIKLCPPLIKKGNKNLISDVAVAAILLESAFTSAYFIVQESIKHFPIPLRKSPKVMALAKGGQTIVPQLIAEGDFLDVEINLKNFPDKKLTKQIKAELAKKKKQITRIKEDMEEKVGEIIRG